MTWLLSVHPEVWDDADDAMEYYAGVEDYLPQRFIAEVDAALDFAEHFALAGRPLYTKYRRIALRRFPYLLCYRVVDDVVHVLAVVHDRRNPKWVRARLSARAR